MLKVMKKVTNDVELEGAVSYLLTAVDASAPPHIKMSIDPPDGSPEGRLTDRLMRLPHRALVNLGQIQFVHIPAPIGANEPVDVQGGITPTHFREAPP